MKCSKTINLLFIGTLATSIIACQEEQNQQCVDKDGVVVDESKCNSNDPNHRWYYGGGLFNHGSRVSGGSYVPRSGISYARPSQHSYSSGSHVGSGSHTPSVSKGGFGSSGFHSSGS